MRNGDLCPECPTMRLKNKGENHTIISMEAEKAYDKIQIPCFGGGVNGDFIVLWAQSFCLR